MAKSEGGPQLDYLPVLPRDPGVGIGCVGAGFIMADCHLVAYRAAGLNPVAITSRRNDQAQQVARRHGIETVHDDVESLARDPRVEVVDVAVPPDRQAEILFQLVRHARHLKGVLAQKPLGVDFQQAREIVRAFRKAKLPLVVNQNMRYDQSVRACRDLLAQGLLGEPVLATIDMRAIPHWMPWQQRQGWVTLRIMSIHHLDTFRFWFGDPVRVFASVAPDPRTSRHFRHRDGICLYVLEYADGRRASSWDDVWTGPGAEGAAEDLGIRWRVEGTEGMGRGTIGWPKYPKRTPSTLDYTCTRFGPQWFRPRWREVWFPDAFAGPMCELLTAIETGQAADLDAEDNLKTMALVEACYASAREHRAVPIREILSARRSAR